MRQRIRAFLDWVLGRRSTEPPMTPEKVEADRVVLNLEERVQRLERAYGGDDEHIAAEIRALRRMGER